MRSLNYIDVINRMCAELAEVSAEGNKHFDTSLLGDRLQELAKESPDDQVWRALSYACNYLTGSDGPFTFGPYSPMFVLPIGGDEYSVFPPPLEQIETDVLNLLNEHELIIAEYNSWYDYRLCITRQRADGLKRTR